MLTAPLGCGRGQNQGHPVALPKRDIYSVSIDGSNNHRLNVAGIALSRGPDGRIALLHGKRLAVMRDDGTGLRILARADTGSEDPLVPSWSPDGQQLAAENGRGCDPFVNCRSWSISVIDVATGKLRAVIPWARAPSWSPDGRKIAFVGGHLVGDPHAAVKVQVIAARPDGTGRRVLTQGGLPVWSPTGTELAVFGQVRRGGHVGVYLIRPDGTRHQLLARSEPVFSWSPDGRRLAYVGPFGIPDHLEVVSIASGRRKRIGATDFNKAGAVSWSSDGSKLVFVRHDYRRDLDRLMIAPADASTPPYEIARTQKRQRIWTPIFTKDRERVLFSVWRLSAKS